MLASSVTSTDPRAYRLRSRCTSPDRMIMAKLRRQRKRRLDAEDTQQSGDHAGKPPLRDGHAIGHERTNQQHRQIE